MMHSAQDIRARLGNGTGNLKSMQRLWQSHDISIDTKVRLLKSTVWSAATYGCEGWTLQKSDASRIEAFEMKGLRSGFSTANQTPISLIADQHDKMISDQARRCMPVARGGSTGSIEPPPLSRNLDQPWWQ